MAGKWNKGIFRIVFCPRRDVRVRPIELCCSEEIKSDIGALTLDRASEFGNPTRRLT